MAVGRASKAGEGNEVTGNQFKAAIERLGKSQVQFARENAINDRTVRSWIADRPPVLVANYTNALLELFTGPKRKTSKAK